MRVPQISSVPFVTVVDIWCERRYGRAMNFIDERITDCSKRLESVTSQINDLRRQAALIEGELRAYRAMKENASIVGGTPHLAKAKSKAIVTEATPSTSGPEKVSFSRLSPVWQHIFGVMVSAYPRAFTGDEIRDLAMECGHDPGDSFRTALWHHQKRGSIDRNFNGGTYTANERTAKKAGVLWGGER
jgi:hypothetical protein